MPETPDQPATPAPAEPAVAPAAPAAAPPPAAPAQPAQQPGEGDGGTPASSPAGEPAAPAQTPQAPARSGTDGGFVGMTPQQDGGFINPETGQPMTSEDMVRDLYAREMQREYKAEVDKIAGEFPNVPREVIEGAADPESARKIAQAFANQLKEAEQKARAGLQTDPGSGNGQDDPNPKDLDGFLDSAEKKAGAGQATK